MSNNLFREFFVLCVFVFGYILVMRYSIRYWYDIFYGAICSKPLVREPEGVQKWFKLFLVYIIIVAVYVVSGGAIGSFLAAENAVLAESISVGGRTISATNFYVQLPAYIWCAGIFGILVAALARATIVCVDLTAICNALFFQAISTLAALLLFMPPIGPLELSRGEVLNPLMNAIAAFPLDRLLALGLLLVLVGVGTEIAIRHRWSAPAGG